MTLSLRARALLTSAVLFSSVAHAIPESAQLNAADALARLRANAGGLLTQSANPALAYTLLRADGALPLLQDNALAAPIDRALNFLSLNGAALGVSDARNEFVLARIERGVNGHQTVHLNQVHAGLPVFGARLVVHLGPSGVMGVNGVYVPGLDAAPKSNQASIATLRDNALLKAAKRHRGATLSIESTRLMYYRSGLLEGLQGRNYLSYEVMVRGLPGQRVRERYILDAVTGTELLYLNEVHDVLNREIYTPTMDVPPVLSEGSPVAPADQPLVLDDRSAMSSRVPPVPYIVGVSNLYVFAGGTYNLYKNLFGREGYDDGARTPEEQVQQSVYLVNDQCPNAYWDGTSTNYCPGFDADDVVSHEWSHAYTEYTHGLMYAYQSGALNEAYSDIFGETYDLTNGIEGPLGVTFTEGDYFENGGSRWVLGEDLSAAAAGILLRDMWDPDNFGVNVAQLGLQVLSTPSPGSVITSPNYYCGSSQSKLVHTNSGVPNHAYAMLVDGKEFNGVTIPKIGMTKAAHIYFQAETHYQTPTTNFSQHADALEASCKDLIGVDLNDVTGQVSGEKITPADCAAVAAAALAVELRQPDHEKCGYGPLLRPEAETPALCSSGQQEVADFTENWEGSTDFPAGWKVSNNFTGDNPVHYPWIVSADVPAPHTGHAAYVQNERKGGGVAGSGKDQTGSTLLESPEITLSNDASYFKFTHLVQTEADFDGGNLKVSVNGGAFTLVTADAITFNPYNTTLLAASDNTSPLAGEPAFSGADQGENTGSWGTTVVDLAKLGAKAGDTLKFRFDYGQDVATGNLGWYIDDVSVVHCGVGAPTTPVVNEPVKPRRGRFGGALGLGLLLPFALFGLRRRTR